MNSIRKILLSPPQYYKEGNRRLNPCILYLPLHKSLCIKTDDWEFMKDDEFQEGFAQACENGDKFYRGDIIACSPLKCKTINCDYDHEAEWQNRD